MLFLNSAEGAACLFLEESSELFWRVYKEKLSFYILLNLQNFQWLQKKNRFKHAGVTFQSSGYRRLMEMFCKWVSDRNNVYPLSNTRCLLVSGACRKRTTFSCFKCHSHPPFFSLCSTPLSSQLSIGSLTLPGSRYLEQPKSFYFLACLLSDWRTITSRLLVQPEIVNLLVLISVSSNRPLSQPP